MKRSRFSDEQIIGILKEHQAGMTASELCRKHGISDTSFYTRRKRYGGMEVNSSNLSRSIGIRPSLTARARLRSRAWRRPAGATACRTLP